jgi:hypothetical protein
MYTQKNYKTKKAIREDLEAGIRVMLFEPGPFGGGAPINGTVYLEGPHYPEPHRWYATGTAKDGALISLKK